MNVASELLENQTATMECIVSQLQSRNIQEDMIKWICKCLHTNPKHRPTSQELANAFDTMQLEKATVKALIFGDSMFFNMSSHCIDGKAPLRIQFKRFAGYELSSAGMFFIIVNSLFQQRRKNTKCLY